MKEGVAHAALLSSTRNGLHAPWYSVCTAPARPSGKAQVFANGEPGLFEFLGHVWATDQRRSMELVMGAARWPDWWEWEVELTPHLERRMEDRSFSEVDLRGMLERAPHKVDRA